MDYMDRFGVWGFGVACGEVLVKDCPKHKGGGALRLFGAPAKNHVLM